MAREHAAGTPAFAVEFEPRGEGERYDPVAGPRKRVACSAASAYLNLAARSGVRAPPPALSYPTGGGGNAVQS